MYTPVGTAQSIPGPLALLNAPVLTDYGSFRMVPVTADEARSLVQQRGFVSAVGHQAAADVLSRMLGIDCPVRRLRHCQQPGHQALILRLDTRLNEGEVVASADEMQRLGYSLALLTRFD